MVDCWRMSSGWDASMRSCTKVTKMFVLVAGLTHETRRNVSIPEPTEMATREDGHDGRHHCWETNDVAYEPCCRTGEEGECQREV